MRRPTDVDQAKYAGTENIEQQKKEFDVAQVMTCNAGCSQPLSHDGACDRYGFDPDTQACPVCLAEVGAPCVWAPQTIHPAYHAGRLEAAQFDAAVSAQLAGTAPDQEQWSADVKAAAEELV